MQLYLDDIATKVTPVHTRSSSSIKPDGIAPKHPPRTPELNDLENIWQFMRQTR
jgi:hypothetical protein